MLTKSVSGMLLKHVKLCISLNLLNPKIFPGTSHKKVPNFWSKNNLFWTDFMTNVVQMFSVIINFNFMKSKKEFITKKPLFSAKMST